MKTGTIVWVRFDAALHDEEDCWTSYVYCGVELAGTVAFFLLREVSTTDYLMVRADQVLYLESTDARTE